MLSQGNIDWYLIHCVLANLKELHAFFIRLRTSKFLPRLAVLKFLHNLSLNCIVLVPFMSVIHLVLCGIILINFFSA